MTVGLTLTDRAKDHKTLVLGLLLVKLEGDFLRAIVCKTKRLAINVSVRAEDAESGGGCIDIQLDPTLLCLVDEKVIRLLSSD